MASTVKNGNDRLRKGNRIRRARSLKGTSYTQCIGLLRKNEVYTCVALAWFVLFRERHDLRRYRTGSWRNDALAKSPVTKEILYSNPFLERPKKLFSACMFIYIHDRSINSFEGHATKLSVKETNWTGLWARTDATVFPDTDMNLVWVNKWSEDQGFAAVLSHVQAYRHFFKWFHRLDFL